jgi:peptidoglycan/xylan/chitin deacetylase (PgdA/CDA1 family)
MMMVDFFNRIQWKIYWNIAKRVAKKTASLAPQRKIVSFTFDDFPKTAIEHGARILELNNARGTFYAALGLAGTDGLCGMIGTAEEMMELAQRGHEIGCHTFQHLNCLKSSSNKIDMDCQKNRAMAQSIAGERLTSFAYPYGRMNPFSKRTIGRNYRTARTNKQGINSGMIDLAALLSVAIYSRRGWQVVQEQIDKLDATDSGWLIFLTHDVAPQPSPYGCTPELFESTLKECILKRFEILTVRSVTETAIQLKGGHTGQEADW